jgi:hypothetical protein
VFYLVHVVGYYTECKEMYGVKNIKCKREDVVRNFGRFGCFFIYFLFCIEDVNLFSVVCQTVPSCSRDCG